MLRFPTISRDTHHTACRLSFQMPNSVRSRAAEAWVQGHVQDAHGGKAVEVEAAPFRGLARLDLGGLL